MKTQSVVNTRLIENKERLLLNFVFSLWFEKALEDVNNGKDEKKKKRYAQLDPFKMVAEPPVVFKEDYFYMCAADRPGGTLLVDKKVPYLTLDTFLEKAKASDKIDPNGTFNQTLADAVKNKTVNFKLIRELIASPSNLSTDPIYYLTKMYEVNNSEGEETGSEEETSTTQSDTPATQAAADNEDTSEDTSSDEGQKEEGGEYFIIFDSKSTEVDFDALVSWIFRDYTFEEISLECVEEGDSDYPTTVPDAATPASFYTGTVTVKDSTFKEKSFTFHFVDMNLLAKVVASLVPVDPSDAEIVDVTPTEPEPIPPSAEEQVIGKGTVIKTSAKVEDDTVLLSEVKDDLGNDLTGSSELVITDNTSEKVTASIKVKDLDYAYSFNYDTGERRRISAVFKLKGQTTDGKKATIPVSYDLENASITPVIESMDFTNGLSNAEIQLSFLDKDNNPISKVVPQTLGEGYKMFDTDNDVLTFLGEATQFGESNEETAKNILKFNIALKNYGSVDFKFTDPALKEITYDVVDPDAKLTVDLVKIDYTDDTLTLTYNVLQNGTIYETDEKQYTNIGLPKITLNDTVYKPQTTWTKAGLINTYVIGKGVNATNVMVRGQIMIGANSVIAGFMDNITIGASDDISKTTATISSIVLNGGFVTPSDAQTTTNVGNGSIIIISDANQVKANGIKLTRFTDPLGVNITDKVSAVFTQLDDDATQFGINMTISNYQWPMSFDNQGSNGEFECEFTLLGNPDSVKSAKTTYKLEYGYEGITPRPMSAHLTNNSLNNAVIFIAFTDKYRETFNTGIEQSIPINPPLFGNSDLTYIGDKITYDQGAKYYYGAYIPVNFKQFGDLSLSFADTTFKTVPVSLADPNGSYTLESFEDGFKQDDFYYVNFRLKKDGQPYSLNDGAVIENSFLVYINDKLPTYSLTWLPDSDNGAVLNLSIAFPIGESKAKFTTKINGQYGVGINKVPLSVVYDQTYTPV